MGVSRFIEERFDGCSGAGAGEGVTGDSIVPRMAAAIGLGEIVQTIRTILASALLAS
jgi:hypothetical protein